MTEHKDKGGGASSHASHAPHAAHERGKVPTPGATASTAARTGPGGRAVAKEPPPPTQVDPAVVAVAVAAATAAVEKQRAGAMATPNMDRTVPGGVYIVDGRVVDAWGDEREMPGEGEGEDEDKPSSKPAEEKEKP